jgi:hypothetical protein
MTAEHKLDFFIEQNRKICWEAEYEKGEYCIGEQKVKKFFTALREENERLRAGLTADEMGQLIDKHIVKMWGGLEMASVEHFMKTGAINGSFRLRLLSMLQFADWKLQRKAETK